MLAPPQNALEQLRVLAGCCPSAQLAELCQTETQRLRPQHAAPNPGRGYGSPHTFTRHRQLIEPTGRTGHAPVHDPRMPDSQQPQRLGDHVDALLCIHPDDLRRGARGLVRGPARLKIVRNGSARRTGPTRRMAGCSAGASRNMKPVARRHSAAASGSRVVGTPSASRTSAEPQREVTARFPCLATQAPAPAATSAAAVEIFSVSRPSPPVPQVSTRRARSSGAQGNRCCRCPHCLGEAAQLLCRFAACRHGGEQPGKRHDERVGEGIGQGVGQRIRGMRVRAGEQCGQDLARLCPAQRPPIFDHRLYQRAKLICLHPNMVAEHTPIQPRIPLSRRPPCPTRKQSPQPSFPPARKKP